MTTDLNVLVSGMCSAVREPMSVDALVGYIRSDEYSAELALQHALIALNDSQQQRRILEGLVDGCYEIVEIFPAQTSAQKDWKRDWLFRAHSMVPQF